MTSALQRRLAQWRLLAYPAAPSTLPGPQERHLDLDRSLPDVRHHPAPTPPAQPDPGTDWPALRTRIEASLARLAELCGTDRDQADAERRATARRLDAVGRRLAAAS